MLSLIRHRKAPAGAICPQKIEPKGLFALDVDDDIWQDIGLDNDNGDHQNDNLVPPLWLSDDGVCQGIKALLERDRCVEEESRLQHERRAMQEWFSEEWKVLSSAINHTGSSIYYLKLLCCN